MASLYLLGGHPYPITSIHWRSRDDLLITRCADGTIYVWQMGTGHLDRRATGHIAAEILRGCDGKLNVVAESDTQLSAETMGELLKSTPIMTEGKASTNPVVEVLSFNIRKLLSSVHTNDSGDDDLVFGTVVNAKNNGNNKQRATNLPSGGVLSRPDDSSDGLKKRSASPLLASPQNMSTMLSLIQIIASALIGWGLDVPCSFFFFWMVLCDPSHYVFCLVFSPKWTSCARKSSGYGLFRPTSPWVSRVRRAFCRSSRPV